MSAGTPSAVTIREYRADDRDRVLTLLYELHGSYRDSAVPQQLRQFGEDRDSSAAYSEYLDIVGSGHGEQYMTLVAQDEHAQIVGVIIGSIEHDRWDVLTPAGLIEDWFRAGGCRQVKSDTWIGNRLSRDVHAALGFVEYGVDLRKRL